VPAFLVKLLQEQEQLAISCRLRRIHKLAGLFGLEALFTNRSMVAFFRYDELS